MWGDNIKKSDLKERLTDCKINLLDSERPVERSCQHGSENSVLTQLRNLLIVQRNKLFIKKLVLSLTCQRRL